MNGFFTRFKSSLLLALLMASLYPMPLPAADSLPIQSGSTTHSNVDFDRDILPILQASCFRCHGAEKPQSDFRLDYREGALEGGDLNTNDLVVGHSDQSMLIAYVTGKVRDMVMPPEDAGSRLTPTQIQFLRAWIDEGLAWGSTPQAQSFTGTVSPSFQDYLVSGNSGKFRELQGVQNGFSAGMDSFSAKEQLSPDENMTLDGHVLLPEQDLSFKLSLEKTGRGFIHAGFDQWRKYYAQDGGFDPLVAAPPANPNPNLYVDNGDAWIDLGLDHPGWPLMTLGYEYQYRKGMESTLDWGFDNGKNILASSQSLNEQTHSIKLDISKTLDDWNLENYSRLDFFSHANNGMESGILTGGVIPGQFISTSDHYQQVQGVDTLTVSRHIRDWWLLDAGYYYSRLSGGDYFNQANTIPAFSFNNSLQSSKISLGRESQIFSVANLLTPFNGLALVLDAQEEWTREEGFGESVPDLDLGINTPANSSLEEVKAMQNAGVRYTRIPFTSLFAESRINEDAYGIYQAQNTGVAGSDIERNTDANNLCYDLKAGFDTSPWNWADLVTQGSEHFSDTAYNQLNGVFDGMGSPTNGYPSFILNRLISSAQFETKLVLHPASWLKTTLTYQLTDTQYQTRTDPAYDSTVQTLVSQGGTIADGNCELQTFGVSATITPMRKLFLSGSMTYSRSRTSTADNNDPSIVPYQGEIYTLIASANYSVNPKTRLQLACNFSHANYAQNNTFAGVPAGLDYTRQDFIIGLSRQFTENLGGAIHFEFSQYEEPGVASVNNYSANGIFASLTYQWH